MYCELERCNFALATSIGVSVLYNETRDLGIFAIIYGLEKGHTFCQRNDARIDCKIPKICILHGQPPSLIITHEATSRCIVQDPNAYAFLSLLRLHIPDHSHRTLSNEQYANRQARQAHQAGQRRSGSGGSSRGQACLCDGSP